MAWRPEHHLGPKRRGGSSAGAGSHAARALLSRGPSRVYWNAQSKRGDSQCAISKLVAGRPTEEVAEVLKGNICGPRKTSCADQFSQALLQAMDAIAEANATGGEKPADAEPATTSPAAN